MYHVALYKEQPHYLLSIFNTSTMAEPKQWRVGQSFSGGVYVVDVDLVKIGQAFSDIELPEVNKIVKGRKFCNLGATSSSTYNAVNVNNKMEDCISKLPDDILQCIISNLTTREGAGTNILSTRWRNLWIKSINSLNFDYANMIGYDYPRNTKFPRFEFTRWVNKIFQLHHGSRLDALRLSLVVNKESFVDVDKWMKLAAAQRVQELDLEFLCGTDISYYASLICGYFPENEYKFPVQAFCSSLKYLHLRYCTFDIPSDFKGFSSLVSMALDSIFLTEYAVQNILSSCSSLEMLSLMNCRFANHTCLKFVGPSLLLKHLCENKVSLSQEQESVAVQGAVRGTGRGPRSKVQ